MICDGEERDLGAGFGGGYGPCPGHPPLAALAPPYALRRGPIAGSALSFEGLLDGLEDAFDVG